MAKVTLKGTISSNTVGELPRVGSKAPEFSLTAADMAEKHLSDYGNRKKILNIVPSLETSVCAASARRFNKEAGARKDVTVLVVSADLPYAQGKFCSVEGLENVTALSTFRSTFPDDYGLRIAEGPMRGLCSRAVMILDENNKVIYTQQVPEIAQEPDYEDVLAAL